MRSHPLWLQPEEEIRDPLGRFLHVHAACGAAGRRVKQARQFSNQYDHDAVRGFLRSNFASEGAEAHHAFLPIDRHVYTHIYIYIYIYT